MPEAIASASAWYIWTGVRSSVIAAMGYCYGFALGLLQFLEQFGEPFCLYIKGLAALDAGEFDGAEKTRLRSSSWPINAALAAQAAFHRVLRPWP